MTTQGSEHADRWCNLLRGVMENGAAALEITGRDHRGEWCVSIDGSAYFHHDLTLAIELAATEYLAPRGVVLAPIGLCVEFDEAAATLQYRPVTPDTIAESFPDMQTMVASRNEFQEVVTIEFMALDEATVSYARAFAAANGLLFPNYVRKLFLATMRTNNDSARPDRK